MITPPKSSKVNICIEDVETNQICDARLSVDFVKKGRTSDYYLKVEEDHHIRVLLQVEDQSFWTLEECLVVKVNFYNQGALGDYKVYIPHPETKLSNPQFDGALLTPQGYEFRISRFQAQQESGYKNCVAKVVSARQRSPEPVGRRRSIQPSEQKGTIFVSVHKATTRDTKRSRESSIFTLPKPKVESQAALADGTLTVVLEPEGGSCTDSKDLDFAVTRSEPITTAAFHCRGPEAFEKLVDEYESGFMKLVDEEDGWRVWGPYNDKASTTTAEQNLQDTSGIPMLDRIVTATEETLAAEGALGIVQVFPRVPSEAAAQPNTAYSSTRDKSRDRDRRANSDVVAEEDAGDQRVEDFRSIIEEIRTLNSKIRERKVEAKDMERNLKRKRDSRARELEQLEEQIARGSESLQEEL